MRKLLVAFCIIVLIVGAYIVVRQKVGSDLAQPVFSPSITPTPSLAPPTTTLPRETSLFVPYWSTSGEELTTDTYDYYLYFGITPSKTGIEMEEPGAQGIETFLAAVPQGKEKYLVVRMLNRDNISTILKDQKLEQRVIRESLELAKKHGFDGIVLDLEIAAIPLESLIKQITSFTSRYNIAAKEENLTFGMTLYGDTFYRLRPFDVKALSSNADMFLIMAYDFHKARGNPGPNFPLGGQETYGYDMGRMADDFLRYLPTEKVAVIFGLYGYDWEVDSKGNAISQGKPLSYRELQKTFLSDCSYKACVIQRDSLSTETKITYTDTDDKKHVVWFEDMQSVAQKQKLLNQKGIAAFSFWANGYF